MKKDQPTIATYQNNHDWGLANTEFGEVLNISEPSASITFLIADICVTALYETTWPNSDKKGLTSQHEASEIANNRTKDKKPYP